MTIPSEDHGPTGKAPPLTRSLCTGSFDERVEIPPEQEESLRIVNKGEDGSETDSSSTDKKKKSDAPKQASVSETLGFVFQCGPKVTGLFFLGCAGGFLNGLVFPALAYLFSNSFSDISSAANEGLAQVEELAYTFMVVGVYALIVGTMQGWCFELASYYASQNFRLQWFRALLRQDTAYFDVNDVGGLANQVGPAANKFRRGTGRKFGEGIQFLTTGFGGLLYALIASWQAALVVLSIVPVVSLAGYAVIQLNQSKGTRGAAAYKTAGGVAYSSVSAIRTVLSLNGVKEMVERYKAATNEAFEQATSILVKQGIANGSMLGTFLLLYCILTLFGSFLLYNDIRKTGCDPSAGVSGNETCSSSGPDVFGAMLGVAFAAQGISQFGNFSEAFTAARVSVNAALEVINRKPGSPEKMIYGSSEDEDDLGASRHSLKALGSSRHSKKSKTEEEKVLKAILPKYEIDSTSEAGKIPKEVNGHVRLNAVTFAYPTRPNENVLKELSTEIQPGETVAFVGPSGSGKSTIVGMLERFYDPQSGSVELDGNNLRDLNIYFLRGAIGYVGQEPTLFACSIRANIRYGRPEATDEEIEEAAKLANAHDFVTAFSDGYDTQVGDKGSQLSGGQKQRIAIARVLIGNPKLLILDEATSALDAESELVVQDALDNILKQKKITTVIIAHRLSTIRNCDIINVLSQGEIVETGTHNDLMVREGYYYALVQKQDGSKTNSSSSSPLTSKTNSEADLVALANGDKSETTLHGVPHLRFNNVYFAYPSRPKKTIFKGFNLDIERGNTIALVGPSGGGKSTTVGLIERFYDPSKGAIEYNGEAINTLDLQEYRGKIGYVGQEPTLFNDTIANNIAFGLPGTSREQIEEAAKKANAHDFIMEFPDNYDTPVGERGTQLSGGQKQRVAIARALVRAPEILLLDEATSALDNESEAIVQAAIDKLMQSRQHTCIVIAHRLSTIRGADKIVVVSGGKVMEAGSHDELIAKPNGRYTRLFESSKRESNVAMASLRAETSGKNKNDDDEKEEDIDWEAKIEEEENITFKASRAREMASPDAIYMLIGAVGALMAGSVFPIWGVLFSETINILFRPVPGCNDNMVLNPFTKELEPTGFDSCQEYWNAIKNDMQDTSYTVSGYWILIFFVCIFGNLFTIWGFGTASERLNKRVRDTSFAALLRQEVAYFDKRSVGGITSRLQDDAARIQAFSGEPVRAFLIASSSIITGLTLSFIFMWPFALLAIGCIPFMGAATSLEMKQMLGEDEGTDNAADGSNSPGGVIVETLLNMKTVSALTMEKQRYIDYENALHKEEPNVLKSTFLSGCTVGISQFVQQWINGLQMWFGGWLLFNNPDKYEFRDFLISNFAVLFSLFGLGAAFQDISDRKEVEKSAARIFHLLDRTSEIDPFFAGGKQATVITKENKEEEPPARQNAEPTESTEAFA